MKIAILGTGQVARALGGGAAAAGHDLCYGSRRPETISGLDHPVLAHADAIAKADLVISAVAAARSVANAQAIGADVFADKVVLDLGNAVSSDFSLLYPNASLGQALQQTLPQARIVKSLNTLPAPLMINPAAVPGTSVFVSGDDTGAKATVTAFLQSLGWASDAIIDLGGIESARGPEHYFLLFAALMQAPAGPGRPFNLSIVPSLDG